MELTQLDVTIEGSWQAPTHGNHRWGGWVRAAEPFATLLLVRGADRLFWAKSEVASSSGLPLNLEVHPLDRSGLRVQFIFMVGFGWVHEVSATLAEPHALPRDSVPSYVTAGTVLTAFTANSTPPFVFQLLFLARADVRVGRSRVWRPRKVVETRLPLELLPVLTASRSGVLFAAAV